MAIAVGLVLGIVGLYWLAIDVSRPQRHNADQEPPGAGVIVHDRITHIIVPSAYPELAKAPSFVAALESHEALQHYFRQRGLTKSWYALKSVKQQANGAEVATIYYTQPFETRSKLPEFRAVMERLAGKTPENYQADFSGSTIDTLPDKFAAREPDAVIADLVEWVNSRENAH